MVTDDGMLVFDKVSVTVGTDVTGTDVETVFTEDTDGDAVGGAGAAAVMAWVDSAGGFTAVEAAGFCSAGGEEDSEITGVEATGIAGGNAATVLGIRDMEAWL